MAFVRGTFNYRPAMTGYVADYGDAMGGLGEFGMGNYIGLGFGGGGHHGGHHGGHGGGGGGHHGGGYFPGGYYPGPVQYDWGPSQVEIIVAEEGICKSCREGTVSGPACAACGPKVP